MRQSLRIIFNVGTNYAREAISIAITLILTPFLYHHLGKDAWGVIVLTNSTSGLLRLLDVGLAHGVARYVSKHVTQGDHRKVGQVVSTCLAMYVVAGLIAFGVVACIALFFLDALKVPAELQSEARIVLLLAGVGLGLRFPGTAFEGVLRGVQRFELVNASVLSDRLVYALGLFVGIGGLRFGLVWVGVCILAATVVCQLVRIISAYRVCRPLVLGVHLISAETFRELISFGTMAFLTQISAVVEGTGLRFIVSAALSSTILGVYGVLLQILLLPNRLATAVNTVVMPVASKYETQQDMVRLRMLLLDGSRLILSIIAPVGVWIMVMSWSILATWIGAEMAQWAPLLALLTAVRLLDQACGSGNMMLMGMGKARVLGTTYIIASGLALVLLIALLLLTKLGLYAIVISAGSGMLVRRGVILGYMCRSIGLGVRTYVWRVLAPVAGTAGLTACTLLAVRQLWLSVGWDVVICSAVIAGVVYWGITWRLVLSEADRKRVRGMCDEFAAKIGSRVGRSPQ